MPSQLSRMRLLDMPLARRLILGHHARNVACIKGSEQKSTTGSMARGQHLACQKGLRALCASQLGCSGWSFYSTIGLRRNCSWRVLAAKHGQHSHKHIAMALFEGSW